MMEGRGRSTAPEQPQPEQPHPDRNGRPPRSVLVTSVHDSGVVCVVPVTNIEPQDPWRRRFSVPLGQGRWALLYKLQLYNLEELMREDYVMLNREHLSPDIVQAVEQVRLSLFVDSSEQHIDTEIRTLKKYDTVDGNIAIVLSRREINKYIDPIVLIKKEDPMLPRPMQKGHLIADSGRRLDVGEKRAVARVLTKLLQPIPTATLEPTVCLGAIRQLLEEQLNLSRASFQDCDERFEAYSSPAMAETMLMIYYRHKRRGCNGFCPPCNTVAAMMTHVLDVCNANPCPQKQFLVTAFAKHVTVAGCGADCSIPFCGQVNFLVRPGDVVRPSLWLSRMVIEKMKQYSGVAARML